MSWCWFTRTGRAVLEKPREGFEPPTCSLQGSCSGQPELPRPTPYGRPGAYEVKDSDSLSKWRSNGCTQRRLSHLSKLNFVSVLEIRELRTSNTQRTPMYHAISTVYRSGLLSHTSTMSARSTKPSARIRPLSLRLICRSRIVWPHSSSQ